MHQDLAQLYGNKLVECLGPSINCKTMKIRKLMSDLLLIEPCNSLLLYF